jgi:hypothetical protein
MQDYLIIESTISQDIVFLSRKNYIMGVFLKKNHNKQISIDKGAVGPCTESTKGASSC